MLSRCILALAIGSGVLAQDSAFTADVNGVFLYATVRDPKARMITNLAKEDFALLEDGKRQRIRYFSREFDAPLIVGLVVDTCPWQLHVMQSVKGASNTFLDRVFAGNDKAFVLHFDRSVELLQDLTSSR